ncbi:MAG: hypothetical protein D6808_07480 [Candidatus Dadabacteria bacterium]|nr:MAG: hypothetical protein D6808_07480 [Candidatus Dadabacteria bacterium]
MSASRSLAKQIFKADLPEQVVKEMSAQTFYLAIKSEGVRNSWDLIELADKDKIQLCLDFDLWRKDRFDEERFWDWLSLSDAEKILEPIQKILSGIDLKLIALMICRYVESVVLEEPTQTPPGADFYTPDKGYTWIKINIEDSDHHRLMGRLLAYIFEASPELFYQLLSIPTVATPSELEEEAYQEKSKRLFAEGIPDDEFAFALNTPMTVEDYKVKFGRAEEGISQGRYDLVQRVTLLSAGFPVCELVDELVRKLAKEGRKGEFDEFEAELTLLANAALVRFGVDFSELLEVQQAVEQVRGAFNIGLEIVCGELSEDPLSVYRRGGIKPIYQVGLGALFNVRSEAQKALRQLQAHPDEDRKTPLLEPLSRPMPLCPEEILPKRETSASEELTVRPFYTIREIKTALSFCTAGKKGIQIS